MRFTMALRLVAVTLLLLLCHIVAQAQVIAVKAGKLADPETGTVAVNQIILVEGQTIKAVGADIKIPDGATIIDLSDRTVLPGLFDAHTHLCMTLRKERDGGKYYFTTLIDSNAYRAIQGVANARAMLESGFTTVRDVGNSGNYVDSDLRRSIEEGLVSGPTIVNAGRIIAPYGGQFQMQPDKPGLGNPEYFYADTLDELKKAVRENIHYGATVIKIVVDDQAYIYSVEDIKFVIDEAKRAGLKVAAHCWTAQGARNAAEAGVASIEHGMQMSDEVLQIAKKNNVILVGTDFTEQALVDTGFALPFAKELSAKIIDRLRRAHKIGVTMAYGTDIIFAKEGHIRGTLSLSTLDSFIAAGIPAKDILRIITINAARLLGVDKQRGTIKPGMAADIIATPDNPLDNILALRKVDFVMKEGKMIKQRK
jgi:imidazolonepropionase-like amidohydrolase